MGHTGYSGAGESSNRVEKEAPALKNVDISPPFFFSFNNNDNNNNNAIIRFQLSFAKNS